MTNSVAQNVVCRLLGENDITLSTSDLENAFHFAHRNKYTLELLSRIANYDNVDLSAEVIRRSSFYVHEKTVEFQWNQYVDVSSWVDPATGSPLKEPEVNSLYALMGKASDEVTKNVRDICIRIDKDLEKALIAASSEEQAENDLTAMGHVFTLDGELDYDEGEDSVPFTELSDEAKKAAIEQQVQVNIDSDWDEPVLDSWKERLSEMGFGNPKDIDIRYSGFYSQGDGASFTTDKTFDFVAYANYIKSGRAADLLL